MIFLSSLIVILLNNKIFEVTEKNLFRSSGIIFFLFGYAYL